MHLGYFNKGDELQPVEKEESYPSISGVRQGGEEGKN